MKKNNERPYHRENRTRSDRPANDPARDRSDINDSERDKERLRPDEATIDLPDVKDIPGQEFVNVPPLGMMADTTISSADEEGEGLFEEDEEDETDIVMGTDTDITNEEREILERGQNYMPTHDEAYLQQASMDSTDFEGERLNEKSFGEERSGDDLDTATASDDKDTTRDAMGQGDEENKTYSLGGDANENNETRTG